MLIRSISRFASRVIGKTSLETVLIVPFVFQVVLVVVLVGYLSHRNAQEAIDNVVAQLTIKISKRVELYLQTYLTIPHLINRINVDAVRLGQLNLQDLPKLERYLYFQLQQFDSVTGILFGNPQGNFIVTTRHTGKTTLLISDKLDTSKIYIYATDSFGRRGKLQKIFRQPDVRQRPWYKLAESAGKPNWTQIFPIGDNTDLTINVNRPIYSQANNEFLGVFSASLNLKAINKFLQGLQISKSGIIFIMERNGLLIANSTKEKPYIITRQKEFKRLKATESSNTLIRDTSLYLNANFGSDLSQITNSKTFDFNIQGERQFVQIIPYQDKYGLDWLIVVVLPEADFMEKINSDTHTTILLCVAALFGSISIAILTARWLTKPILHLNAAAKDIAKGEYKAVEIERADEVGELAKSFNQMVEQLQQSFAELKSLNAALVQSESRLNQILEAIPVGVSVHNTAGKMIYANQASRQLLGIESLPEAEAAQLAEVFQAYQAGTDHLYPIENIPIIRSLKGERTRVDDMEIRLPNRTVPLEVYSTPLLDETGQIVAAIAGFMDITERKQAEKIIADYNRNLEAKVVQRTAELANTNELLKLEIIERKRTEAELALAKQAAEAANLAKSRFLANMSHELRTPLNGILGYAQILQSNKNSTSHQQQAVQVIHQCGEHLLTLINDILDLSKIEAEKLELIPENFHLPFCLTSVSDIFRLKAQQKSIHFTYLPLTPLPTTVHADEKRLRQVLINLLSNAIKFTENGSVNFKVQVLSQGVQEQSIQNSKAKTQNCRIRFEVEDTGVGIHPHYLEKIFLPFEQVGDSSCRTEGTGLGLAISQKIANLMGSQIVVESTPQVGSKFWFEVDLLEVFNQIGSKTVTVTNTVIGYHGEKRKILLVDDHWENNSVLSSILKPIGFEILVATDGQEGLEKAFQFQPDLIITDLVMPVKDGFEMARHLRQLPEFQNTIIIASSATVLASYQQKSQEAGCQDFLPKPIKAQELLNKIKSYLNLVWVYEKNQAGEQETSPVPISQNNLELVVPPKEKLVNLYQVASEGDVLGVQREAMNFKQLNPEYASFIQRVLEFAEDFEYERIMQIIDDISP